MARPRKNKLAEVEPVVSLEGIAITTDIVPEIPAAPAPTEAAPVEKVAAPAPAPEVINPPTPPPPLIEPEADRYEMDRYICVINNSEQASRISQAISHQRDLQMWGVHQYDKNQSRNSYSRSFYFKNRDNAVRALEHANNLLAQ